MILGIYRINYDKRRRMRERLLPKGSRTYEADPVKSSAAADDSSAVRIKSPFAGDAITETRGARQATGSLISHISYLSGRGGEGSPQS